MHPVYRIVQNRSRLQRIDHSRIVCAQDLDSAVLGSAQSMHFSGWFTPQIMQGFGARFVSDTARGGSTKTGFFMFHAVPRNTLRCLQD